MSESVAGSDTEKVLQELRASGLPMSDDMQHRVVIGAVALKSAVSRLSKYLDELSAQNILENDQG